MTAVAEPPTRAPKFEFVNREEAERHAALAVSLLNASDESKVEAWFAMQAVADQVGPASNVGVRGLYYRDEGTKGASYVLRAKCVERPIDTRLRAPNTIELARSPEFLDNAVEQFNRRIAGAGGRVTAAHRSKGTGAALIAAVEATDVGREWLSRCVRESARRSLLSMVNVADAYGRGGANPHACLGAHLCLITFPQRAEFVREYTTTHAAQAKAYALGRGRLAEKVDTPLIAISQTRVNRLALQAGVSPREARTILRAREDGRSKAKLIRAINLAFES